MLSQVFLLPHMDGIAEFTLLFVVVTAASAWITTSSPRISYAGAQTAFAFYVTHLRTFGPQTSLAIARDDVFGILFGLGAMWMTFDRIWVKDTRADLIDLFVSNLRRIAAFDRHAAGDDLRRVIDKVRAERATINDSFDQIRNLSDSLIFEFGANWTAKRRLRDQFRRWQPLLRTYFLLQVALLHYRLEAERGKLDPVIEDRVSQSQEVLSALADLKDRAKADMASEAQQRADSLISRFAELEKASGTGLGTAMDQPARLSQSMLEVAVSIAQEMRQAA
jgi:multidrug resistance protein MdtO